MSNMKRVFVSLCGYPPTWLALGSLAGLEWLLLTWFDPPLPWAGAFLGAGLLLLLLWPVLLLRSVDFVRRLYGAPDQALLERAAEIDELQRDLETLGCPQGAEQLTLLRQKLDGLVGVLKHRLHAGELTYGRYLGAGEQVYLAAIDNLREAAVALTSANAIDPHYIGKRLKALASGRNEEPVQSDEVAALEGRKALLEQQTQKVADLIAENEVAITALARTAAVLADTKTGRGEASMDARSAMAELEELANRAGRYAARPDTRS